MFGDVNNEGGQGDPPETTQGDPPETTQGKKSTLIRPRSSKTRPENLSVNQANPNSAETGDNPAPSSKTRRSPSAAIEFEHRSKMEIMQFESDQRREQRDFKTYTSFVVVILIGMAIVGYSPWFDPQGSTRVRETLLTLLTTFVGGLFGRLLRPGESKSTTPPPQT